MDVIILAGGKGTRLQSVVSDVPKPMATVNGKPFLAFILDWIASYSIGKIILSIGYKGEIIQDYFGDDYAGIPIEYAFEKEPLGTGGGILFASQYTDNANVLVVNGDTWFPIPIDQLIDFHNKEKGQLSIALKKMYQFDRYGTVLLSKNTIAQFNEKQYKEEGLINGGIYLMNKSLLTAFSLNSSFSFETEVLAKRVVDEVLKGIVFDTEFLDIGIPEDYAKASSILKFNE